MEQNRRRFLKIGAALSVASVIAPTTILANEEYGEASLFKGKGKVKNLFLTKPYLQNLTDDSVTVFWVVAKPSYSWVEYGETEELGNVAKTIEDGLVMANNTLNSIVITGLKPDKQYYYRVFSKEIKKYHPYDIKYGETEKSEIFHFKTMSDNDNELSMSILNDLHNSPGSISHMLRYADKNSMDFLFFNGDILNHTDSEQQIVDDMLKVTGEELDGEIPFYFVRGNHEVRGVYARNLRNYFSNPGGRQYYDFVHGPVHFTVFDTGEDKSDDSKVYAGLTDFDDYRKEQQEWFKNEVSKSKAFKEAKYRVVLMHIPFYHSDDWYTTLQLRDLFADLFNETGVNMCISGHTHKFGVYTPETGKHNYPIIIGGGPSKGNRTIINLHANNLTLTLSMVRDDGKEVGSYTLNS